MHICFYHDTKINFIRHTLTLFIHVRPICIMHVAVTHDLSICLFVNLAFGGPLMTGSATSLINALCKSQF